jgi:hypothetical protein
VLEQAARFSLSPTADSWWDLWHYHADWFGIGNLRWRYRRTYVRALATVYERIASAHLAFHTPFQLFFGLSTDAASDAVYLHTPNPNTSNFPFRPTRYSWGAPWPHPELPELFPSKPFRVGLAPRPAPDDAEAEWPFFLIYSPDVGVSLEGEHP